MKNNDEQSMSGNVAKQPARIHELKTLPIFFEETDANRKPWELRINDRQFRVGDWLRLREWDFVPATYSGRDLFARIRYILRPEMMNLFKPEGCPTGIRDGHVVMTIEILRLWEFCDGLETYAAFDGESALRVAMTMTGCARLDYLDEEGGFSHLTQKDLDRLRFDPDLDSIEATPESEMLSFREQLGREVRGSVLDEAGVFPKFFAATES